MKEQDWRLMNQEKFLYRATLKYAIFKPKPVWDHEHCAFCFAKFPDENETGYCTIDERHWVCGDCYNDFKAKFEWVLVEDRESV